MNEYANKLILEVRNLLPEYLANPADSANNRGNTAICIIDNEGQVYGKIFGNDKIIGRRIFRIAWTKASQVWITGMNTGEFEKQVYSGKIDEHKFGIEKPDFVGWEGGQLITFRDGTQFSVGFSGMPGISDLGIVKRAVEKIDL